MQRGHFLSITSTAVFELGRQAAFADSAGMMHIDLVEDTCEENWLHIRLRPGSLNGVPIARRDGVTLYAPAGQLKMFYGLSLNYFGDLSGGGFSISTPEGSESCACGAGFRSLSKRNNKFPD